MKKLLPYITSSIILITGCNKKMSESLTDPAAGFNGGFEHSRKGLPVNWLVYTQQTTGDSDFDVIIDTSDYREGKQSLCFAVRSCSSKGGRLSPGIAQEISVKAGEKYPITCRIKNEGATFAIKASGVNAFHGSASCIFPYAVNTDQWQQVEAQYTIPEEMEKLRFEASVLSPGTFRIDGIEITKLLD